MIRKLLATTALATLLAGGAYAQTTTVDPAKPVASDAAVTVPDGHLASNLIGTRVFNGAGDNAENVGEVNDLVLAADGKVQAVVIGVGGFLGIGEKDVAVDYSQVKWAERDGDRWLVISATKDELTAQTAFDRSAYNPRPAENAAATQPATTDTAASTTTATPDTTQTGAIDRSTLQPVDLGTIRSEELVGTTVYGADDARVGEIGDLALTSDGKVDAVIVDVGGFLGIGEKEVAVAFDNLKFLQDANGNRYLYTSLSKDQLEAQTAYEKGSYADKRDTQRLTVQ